MIDELEGGSAEIGSDTPSTPYSTAAPDDQSPLFQQRTPTLSGAGTSTTLPDPAPKAAASGAFLCLLASLFILGVVCVVAARVVYVRYGRRLLWKKDRVPEVDFYLKDLAV
eukprot:g2255.t1